MRKTKKAKKFRIFDGWTVPHFMFGVVIALMTLVFDWPISTLFLTTFVAAVIWEHFEMRLGIRESRWNLIGDLLLPLPGFFVTVHLVSRSDVSQEQHGALFIAALFAFIYFNVIAWQARFHKEASFLH